jgi:hypothetical protein
MCDIAQKDAIERSCFDIEEVLQEATLAEKVALLSGEASFPDHEVYHRKAAFMNG